MTTKIKETPYAARPAGVSKKEVIICDFCDKETNRQCILCKRDICYDHRISEPEEYGDYPGYYCFKCQNLKFKKYATDYESAQIEYDLKITDLDLKVKHESLEVISPPTHTGEAHD